MVATTTTVVARCSRRLVVAAVSSSFSSPSSSIGPAGIKSIVRAQTSVPPFPHRATPPRTSPPLRGSIGRGCGSSSMSGGRAVDGGDVTTTTTTDETGLGGPRGFRRRHRHRHHTRHQHHTRIRHRRLRHRAAESPSICHVVVVRRSLSSGGTSSNGTTNDVIIDTEDLNDRISRMAESMARGLTRRGYWTNYDDECNNDDDEGDRDEDNDDGDDDSRRILSRDVIKTIRRQAIELRFVDYRYEQSYSEIVDANTGKIIRFDKPGVYACEPDGSDYQTAPDMLHYTATMVRTLPNVLNDEIPYLGLRDDAYNAKLAVTGHGGSKYPRHVDNVSPPTGGGSDYRKLTAILYLNPNWKEGDGGELRLYLKDRGENDVGGDKGRGRGGVAAAAAMMMDGRSGFENVERYVDLSPVGGRLVLFWSDEVPHEVLENAPHVQRGDDQKEDDDHDVKEGGGSPFDRYALTIWVPSDYASLGRSFITPP